MLPGVIIRSDSNMVAITFREGDRIVELLPDDAERLGTALIRAAANVGLRSEVLSARARRQSQIARLANISDELEVIAESMRGT